MIAWNGTIFHGFSDIELLTIINLFAHHKYDLPENLKTRESIKAWESIVKELIKELGQREALLT